MSNALIGFIAVIAILHLFLVVVPLKDTLRARISTQSKFAWSLFLLLLPLVGAFVFQRLFRSGAYQGENYEISAAEERARSGTLAPDDRER